MSAILRIALGLALLALADWSRLAALMDPHPAEHYALHVLWLAGGLLVGDGLWRIAEGRRRRRAQPVETA